MDDSVKREIQMVAADALLNAGVSLPLKEFRLPLTKKKLRLRVTMKRPRLAGQIRIARIYLSMGVSCERIERFTKDEDMAFFAEHGAKISLMVANTICTGVIARLFLRPVAWFLRHCVDHVYLMGAQRKFMSLMGTENFMSIIRSAELANPMKLRLSQKRKGS